MRTYRKSWCGSSPGMRFTPRSRVQWGGIKNGTLLALIEREGFDIFLTGDKNMQSQQRLEGRSFAVLVLSALNWPAIQPHIETIAFAVDAAMPATIRMIDCGEFIRGMKRDKG